MIKLLWSYIIKNHRKNLALVIVLAVSICIIFSNATAKKSQSEYALKVIEENRPKAQLVYDDISGDQLDKIKGEKNIKSMTKVRYYGDVTYKDRFTYGMVDYDNEYFKNYNFKLSQGRVARKSDEIMVYEGIMKKEGFKIGQRIDLSGGKKYYDSSGRIAVENYFIKPRIVGVYTCSEVVENFYFFNNIFVGGELKKVYHKNYNGTIECKYGVEAYSAGLDIASKMNSNSDHVHIDSIVTAINEDKDMLMSERDNLDWSFMILSIFMTFNIVCLMSSQISKEQGLLRVIGLSKFGVLSFEFFRSALLFIFSSCLGVLASGPVSKFLARNFIYSRININIQKTPIVYDWDCMKNVLVVLMIAVTISIAVPSMNIFSKSPIDQYRGVSRFASKYPKVNQFINRIFTGVESRIIIRSIIAQKVFVLVSAVIVAYSGYLYVSQYEMPEEWDKYFLPNTRAFRDYDIRLKRKGIVDELKVGYTKDDVERIKDLDEGVDVYPRNHSFAYMYMTPDKLTKEYMSQRLIKESNKEVEIRFDLMGIPKDLLEDYIAKDKILKSGRLPANTIDGDIAEVLILNNFYLKMDETGTYNVLKDLKLGDVIEMQVATYDKSTNSLGFKTQKMRVVGFMDEVWKSFFDYETFVPDIIMDPVVYSETTGSDKISRIEIRAVGKAAIPAKYNEDIKKNSGKNNKSKKNRENRNLDIENLYKRIKPLFANREYSEIKTFKMHDDQTKVEAKKRSKVDIATSIVLFVLAVTNIVIGIVLSFEVRKKEFGGILSLGMSKNKLKNINMSNAIIIVLLGIIGMVLAVVSSAIILFNDIKWCAEDQFIPFDESIYIPWTQLIIFTLVCVVSVLFVVYFMNRKIDKINIIDMIREEH